MDQNTQRRAEVQLKKQRRKKIWKRIVTALGCVVVFCTTYALILPAITMADEAYCGIEEHKHEDECYTTELLCGFTEEAGTTEEHTHAESCYVKEKNLVCTLEESSGHTHTEECMTKETSLTCGLEESTEHVHDDSCYTENTTYICNQEESEGHTHSDTCWTEVEVLNCELETEVKEEHTHSEECYKEELKCELEEHTHELACFSNPEADVETSADWEKTLPDELSGDWREDVLAVAESQLGYQESDENYIVTEDGLKKGYTRYGDWYGDSYGHWCAMFASFCLDYAEVEGIPLDANCQNWIETLSKEEYELYYKAEEYTPEPGDLIFFDWDTVVSEDNRDSDHVGLVAEVIEATENEPAKVKTIEGNASDCVMYMTYELDDSTILGYGKLPNPPLSEEEQAEVDKVIAAIDALPSSEEIEAKLTEYEEAEDMEGYEAYYMEIAEQAKAAYEAYEALDDELKERVTNIDKLMEISWLWSAVTLSSAEDTEAVDTVNVYWINTYYAITDDGTGTNRNVIMIRENESVGDTLTYDPDCNWWTAIIVEKNSSGTLYVKEILPAGEGISKKDCIATTTGGFVLLVHSMEVDTEVNDFVSVSFEYLTVDGGYQADSYGTVRFGSIKEDKDNTSKLNIVQGADTSELIEVNLYDYGSNINDLYNSNNKYPGFQQDYGTSSADDGSGGLDYLSFNFGNNITSDISAGNARLTVENGTTINATINNGSGLANAPISGKISSTLVNGYPALSDGTSLSYLFSNSDYATKKNTESINGLFLHNSVTGAYTFNSRENHAQFSASTNTFTLYEQVISSNFMMYPFGNFLPFNDITKLSAQASTIDRTYLLEIANSAEYKHSLGMSTSRNEYQTLADELRTFVDLMDERIGNTNWTASDAATAYFEEAGLNKTITNSMLENVYSIDYDEATDFYFGMEMKMNFIQPKDGLTGNDGQQPMVFYFTGDDDVWIYIDGVLFLDLTGIHRHVGGEIDFVNGEVRYYNLDTTTGDVSTTPYKTVKFADILGSTEGLNDKGTFENYSSHSFNFYYMERGAGSGVCRMNFNFPLVPENSISVAKEVTADEEVTNILGDPEYKFQIYNKDGSDLYIGAGVAYDIYDSNAEKIGSGTTDSNGIFTIKADQIAVFNNITNTDDYYFVRELLDEDVYEQYGTIYVDGTAQNGTQVEGFVGVDSPVKHIMEGSTRFTFNNKITTSKLGELQIAKVLEAENTSDKTFEFVVTLDGKAIPKETKYTVGSEERQVGEGGIITLKAGETAVLSNIVAGSVFEVKETDASSSGYTVGYSVDGTATSGTSATGIIKPSSGSTSAVSVTVTNSENGTSVKIPVTKTLNNNDGKEHIYNFKLEQVTDATGVKLLETDGTTQEITISFGGDNTGNTQTGVFTLNYLESKIIEFPSSFYYRISEVSNGEDNTEFDESVYIVEVEVDKSTEGVLEAKITGTWPQDSETQEGIQEIKFVNELYGKLEISKTVEGSSDETKEFEFEVTLKDGEGDPLSGTFDIKKNDATSKEELTFDSTGKATVTLKHGEKIIIYGLPAGTSWTVTETEDSSKGWSVSYRVDDAESTVTGKTATGTIEAEESGDSVEFINATGYALPETGGIGTTKYILGGVLLMVAALLIFIKRLWERRYI